MHPYIHWLIITSPIVEVHVYEFFWDKSTVYQNCTVYIISHTLKNTTILRSRRCYPVGHVFWRVLKGWMGNSMNGRNPQGHKLIRHPIEGAHPISWTSNLRMVTLALGPNILVRFTIHPSSFLQSIVPHSYWWWHWVGPIPPRWLLNFGAPGACWRWSSSSSL